MYYLLCYYTIYSLLEEYSYTVTPVKPLSAPTVNN